MKKHKEYICLECKEPCNAKIFDSGIGPYEYWGQRCVDSQKSLASDCCEAAVALPTSPDEEYTLQDQQEYEQEREAEYRAERLQIGRYSEIKD